METALNKSTPKKKSCPNQKTAGLLQTPETLVFNREGHSGPMMSPTTTPQRSETRH